MKLRNCTRCNKAYQGTNPHICPDCVEAEREEFELVRSFIKDNPKVAIEVVVEATGVEEELVREFLRQGRIDLADLSGPVLECRRCGKPIYRGEYCVICQGEIGRTFRASGESQEQESKPKRRSAFVRRYREGE